MHAIKLDHTTNWNLMWNIYVFRPGVERYGPPTRTEFRLIVENLSSRVSWQVNISQQYLFYCRGMEEGEQHSRHLCIELILIIHVLTFEWNTISFSFVQELYKFKGYLACFAVLKYFFF
jgi:hypothetical protein